MAMKQVVCGGVTLDWYDDDEPALCMSVKSKGLCANFTAFDIYTKHYEEGKDSVDFEEFEAQRFTDIGKLLGDIALALEKGSKNFTKQCGGNCHGGIEVHNFRATFRQERYDGNECNEEDIRVELDQHETKCLLLALQKFFQDFNEDSKTGKVVVPAPE